jgi:hypothetical protein
VTVWVNTQIWILKDIQSVTIVFYGYWDPQQYNKTNWSSWSEEEELTSFSNIRKNCCCIWGYRMVYCISKCNMDRITLKN